MNTIYAKNLKFLPIAALLLFSVFSARGQTLPSPGGINMSGYTVDIWVDGDRYSIPTMQFWYPVLPTLTNSFAQFSTNAPVARNSERFNFHREVYFGNAASSKLASAYPYEVALGNSYHIFVVSDASVATTADATLLTFYGSATNASFRWNASATNILSSYWATTQRSPNFAAANNPRYGIATLNIANSNNGDMAIYLNGLKSSFTLGATTNTSGAVNRNENILLGNASPSATTGSTVPFNGTIQEIIIMKRTSSGGLMTDTDIAKIHSYLAIKYGIMLSNTGSSPDYINSDGTPVWAWGSNPGYNNNVFGIGRDTASGLNQVQSRSAESDLLTIYKGTLNVLNNNSSSELTNKTFLMLGSNNLSGTTKYEHPTGQSFGGGTSITDKINFRSILVYKAQTLTEGVAGGSQTVNMQMSSGIAGNIQYVLVSSGTAFNPSDTRVYPITGQTASNVVINNGEFIAFAGFQGVPGGIDMTSYALDLWVDGDHSSNTSWPNLSSANYQLEQFSTYAPVTRNSRFNFHKEMFFGNYTSSKLRTSANYPVASGNSYYAFVVSESPAADGVLLAFNASGTGANLRWNSSATNILSSYWNTTARAAFPLAANPRYGITTLNVANQNSASLDLYLNGSKSSFPLGTTTAAGAVNSNLPLIIGNASNAAGTGSTMPFNGSIQEVILIKRTSSVALLSDADLRRIHSYLAIKYGITLNNTDHYFNSDLTEVWTRDADFNYNIFGIGRDDNSGLYQKQSASINNSGIVVYLGDATRPDLNSDNTGVFADDKQYLMLGADNPTRLRTLDSPIPKDTEYENGTADDDTGYTIQSPDLKAQLTGLDTITVRITSPSNDFSYVLVSQDPSFPSGASGGTKIYPVDAGSRSAQVGIGVYYKYIKFIGFAPGPGGVSDNLRLWLRADDDSSIELEYNQNQTGILAGYPDDPDPSAYLPGVSAWSDLARNHTYSMAAGATTNQRIPVMKYYSPEMNYYPAVRFWGTDGYGSFLGNANPVISTNNGRPDAHTAIFMVNNNFGTNPWIYPMMFGSATGTTGGANYYGPGYGVQQLTTGQRNVVGRFRTSSTEATGSQHLFEAGATTILGFTQTTATSGSQNPIQFRFNGKVDQTTFTWGEFDMRRGSQIGKGYDWNRTIQGVLSEVIIFEKELNVDERRNLDSYLALKYGVTLYPNNTPTERFNYSFSDNRMIWEGDQYGGKFVDFYNNVAAVIRDDAARLNNRHSHSTNVGSLLHVGVAKPYGEDTYLSDDGSGVGSLNNMEAIAFGSNGATGETQVGAPEDCGDFLYRFNRIWYLNNVSDRDIRLLIGAQNNGSLTIGMDDGTIPYYNILNENSSVTLIIADSPTDITAGNYRAVVPMSFLYGEHQTAFTFPQGDSYITFGYKENARGCYGSVDFYYDKIFRWTQWTSRINPNNNAGPRVIIVDTPVDLGDGVEVLSTQVTYPTGVTPSTGYPRSVTTPAAGSLQVRRSGSLNFDVEIRIELNTSVVPSFQISGLDAVSGSYEEVEIYGTCGGTSIYYPRLQYVSPNNSTYKISGNRATVTRRGSVSGSSANGTVRVNFDGGVTEITILYRLLPGSRTGTRNINISPITFTKAPIPPQYDDYGVALAKGVKNSVSVCETQEFLFDIWNANCEDRDIELFSDTLPEMMSWVRDLIGFDSKSDSLNSPVNNPTFEIEIIPAAPGRGEILNIHNLIVPGARGGAEGVLTMTAAVEFDKYIPPGEYGNRAVVYYITTDPAPMQRTLFSYNRLTGERAPTPFTLTPGEPAEEVLFDAKYSRSTYKENDEVIVTYTYENPNPFDIPELYVDVMFNDEFTFLSGTLSITGDIVTPAPTLMLPLDPGTGAFTIAGDAFGDHGFTLPAEGTIVVQFRLKAPPETDLVYQLDDDDNLTDIPEDLVIESIVECISDDPCITGAVKNLDVIKFIPYGKGKTSIITNQNVTTKIAR